MEILRYLAIAILTTLVAYLTLCLFTPDRVIISETTIINRPMNKVLPNISDINEWPKWHPWFRFAKEDKYKIYTTDSVTNSYISWVSKNRKGGKIKITGYTPNKSIQMDITYEKDDYKKINQGEFLLEEQAGRTKVSWILVGTQYSFFKKPATIVLKGIYAKNYEEGMKNLKALSEGKPLPARSRMDEWSTEE